jgi:hypothetical protein
MPYLSDLLTRVVLPFDIFVLIASLQISTDRAASLALTNGFLIRCVLLVVRETRLATKIPNTIGAGDSESGECARRSSRTIAARLVTDVCGITCARFVTRFTQTSSPSRPLYKRSRDSAVRHHHTVH